MYSGDAHPSYVSVINLRSLYFRFKLNGSSAPTFQYGSNWISKLFGPGQTVPLTGNFPQTTLASNQIAFVAKDNFFDVIDADVAWRDSSNNGQYATLGYGTTSNEGTANPMVCVLTFFQASGSASNNPSGQVGGFLEINNGNITTPGGN